MPFAWRHSLIYWFAGPINDNGGDDVCWYVSFSSVWFFPNDDWMIRIFGWWITATAAAHVFSVSSEYMLRHSASTCTIAALIIILPSFVRVSGDNHTRWAVNKLDRGNNSIRSALSLMTDRVRLIFYFGLCTVLVIIIFGILIFSPLHLDQNIRVGFFFFFISLRVYILLSYFFLHFFLIKLLLFLYFWVVLILFL